MEVVMDGIWVRVRRVAGTSTCTFCLRTILPDQKVCFNPANNLEAHVECYEANVAHGMPEDGVVPAKEEPQAEVTTESLLQRIADSLERIAVALESKPAPRRALQKPHGLRIAQLNYEKLIKRLRDLPTKMHTMARLAMCMGTADRFWVYLLARSTRQGDDVPPEKCPVRDGQPWEICGYEVIIDNDLPLWEVALRSKEE
jgi:hypothetical protein